jgi:hypothetical protein
LNLRDHPKPYIRDTELAILLGGTQDRVHSWIKRAFQKEDLVRLKRGVYLIDHLPIDKFEIAQHLYGPSYISLESALSYHGWIPEAVYTTTSVSTKKSPTITTSIGIFSYEHTPAEQFFMCVDKIGEFLIAQPWKGLADYVYVYRKKWKSMKEMMDDLRIERSSIASSDRRVLEEIAQYYDSPRVRRFAKQMLKEF